MGLQIQFLWWEGCSSYSAAWQRLQQVLDELQVSAHLEQIEIKTAQDAERWKFLGSPTILINGKDIDPDTPPAYRLTCRLYFSEDSQASPLPSETMIKQAILEAQRDQR